MPVVVQHEQGPLPDQHGREAGEPPLSPGQLLQRPPGDRSEPQLVEYGVPLGPRLPRVEPPQPSGRLGGERHGELVEGRRLLAEVAEDPRGPLGVPHDVVPEDLDAAGVGPHQSGELPYEGGLPGAVRPEQSEDLTPADVQPYVVGGPYLGCRGCPASASYRRIGLGQSAHRTHDITTVPKCLCRARTHKGRDYGVPDSA
jgi:hypothetical protein